MKTLGTIALDNFRVNVNTLQNLKSRRSDFPLPIFIDKIKSCGCPEREVRYYNEEELVAYYDKFIADKILSKAKIENARDVKKELTKNNIELRAEKMYQVHKNKTSINLDPRCRLSDIVIKWGFASAATFHNWIRNNKLNLQPLPKHIAFHATKHYSIKELENWWQISKVHFVAPASQICTELKVGILEDMYKQDSILFSDACLAYKINPHNVYAMIKRFGLVKPTVEYREGKFLYYKPSVLDDWFRELITIRNTRIEKAKELMAQRSSNKLLFRKSSSNKNTKPILIS